MFLVYDPGVECGPVLTAFVAILNPDVGKSLEVAVEVLQLHVEQAFLVVGIDDRLLNDEVDRRRRWHEVCAQHHLVVNDGCLVLRGEADADAVVVENALVGLLNGDDLGDGFALLELDGASVDRHSVHQNLESFRVGFFKHDKVVGEIQTLVRVRHIAEIEVDVCALPRRNIVHNCMLGRQLIAYADFQVRLLHLLCSLADFRARLIVLRHLLRLIWVVGLSTKHAEEVAIFWILRFIDVDGEVGVAVSIVDDVVPLRGGLCLGAVSRRASTTILSV